MQVNASDAAAATENVKQQGGTPSDWGGPTQVGGTPAAPGSPSSPSSGQPQGANLAAGTLLLQQAQQAAYQAYLNAKLNLDTDQNAWQKAAQEASTLIAQAGVTGSFQGMPTQAAIKQAADIAAQQSATMLSYATQFGVWGQPQPGSQTLASQKQTFDMANQAAQTTGWYTPYSYNPPQAGQFPQGMGTPQLPQAQAAPATQYQPGTVVRTNNNQFGVVGANGYVTPGDTSNPAIYQAIQRGQGIMTVDDGTWGRATQPPPAAQAPAAQPGAPAPAAGQTIPQQGATLGTPPGWQAGQPVQTLARWQAEQDASQKYLTLLSNLRGPADWAQYQKVLGATPGGMTDLVKAAAGQYVPGTGATTGVNPNAVTLGGFINQATVQPQQQELQSAQGALVAPNQMAPQTWNALQPSQQQMLLGIWESQGYN